MATIQEKFVMVTYPLHYSLIVAVHREYCTCTAVWEHTAV